MKSTITRRGVMQLAGAIGAGVLLEGKLGAQQAAEKTMRFVHLTDMHVPVDGVREEGFAAALAAVAKLDPPPQFMITGGDHVMETFKCPREKALAQWSLYNRTLSAGTKLKIYPVLGNHDIWGWGINDKKLESDAMYGKLMALDQLGMTKSYYSFEQGSWHFIVLDSMTRRGEKYYGAIDPGQMEWLKGNLANVARGRHICIISHIPILCACAFFDGERIRPDYWHVPDAWMHRDLIELQSLFRKHAVRLLISGHIHLHDVVEYNGMTFVCDGAVCGNWWKGAYHETPAGFGVFDLYADGRFKHQYVEFAWKPPVR